MTIKDFRKVIKEAEFENTWLKDISGELKDVAVRDFNEARQAHFAKLKKIRQNDPNAKLEAKFKFRCKKGPRQSFKFELVICSVKEVSLLG